MSNDKKIKLGKLNFYILENNYIEYLSGFDIHIVYNKNEKRPYISVVMIINQKYWTKPKNYIQLLQVIPKVKLLNSIKI